MDYKYINQYYKDAEKKGRYTSLALKKRAIRLATADSIARLNELQDRLNRKALLDYEQWIPNNEILQKIAMKVRYLGYILEDSFIRQLQSVKVRDKILLLQNKIKELESQYVDDDLQLFILMKLKEVKDFIIEECGLQDEFD